MNTEENNPTLQFFSSLVMAYGGKLDKVVQQPFFVEAAKHLNAVKALFDAKEAMGVPDESKKKDK